ncbi:glycosyl hydrolase [Mariannaea sp. PMI_226]|nr:glycosyl hydrolase [Mariannaea sp. PMI_226]
MFQKASSSVSLFLFILLIFLHAGRVSGIPAQRRDSLSFSSTVVTQSLSSKTVRSPIKITLDWSNAKRHKRQTNGTLAPVIDADFPDPSILQDADGKWLTFATSGNGHHVQIATADEPFGPWTLLDQEALPDKGWTSGSNYWAPDVRLLHDGTYIMYFSGQLNSSSSHCIGVARSNTSAGPYTIEGDEPLICPLDQGGAIDPSGFFDEATGKRYIVYKVDGNAANTETPLKLQEVDASDGSTLIGDPVTIMNRIPDEDGPLVEAPDLVKLSDGRYLLFFSSHFYTDDAYDVKYAVADTIDGPYVRGAEPLLSTPQLGLKGPGGATSSEDASVLVFHSYCREKVRCMYVIGYGVR